MRSHRGFSLIEAMIVIVLVAGAALVTLNLLNAEQRRQQRAAMVGEQANEMAVMTRALESYLESSDTLPEDLDTPFTIPAQDLETAGLIPEDFAYRAMSGLTTPTSPLGQEYLLIGVKTAAGYRGAVLPSGAPNAGFLARAGLPDTNEARSEYGVSVMQKLRQDHLAAAGVSKAGELQINREVSGFTFDLSGLLGAALAEPTVISLAGYPEFRPVAPIAIDGGNTGNTPKECYSVNTLNAPLSCDAGYEMAWEYELCSDPAGQPQTYVDTPAGKITITRATSSTDTVSYSVYDSFEGPSEEVGARQAVTWSGTVATPYTSATCPGTVLRADQFTRVNPGDGQTYRYQRLYCAGDGQHYDTNNLSRQGTNRGSTNPSTAPTNHVAGTMGYGHYVLKRAPAGQGLSAVPTGAGLGYKDFLEEGFVRHEIYWGTGIGTIVAPGGGHLKFDTSGYPGYMQGSGSWSNTYSTETCVAGATNEAPAYLMATPLTDPLNSGKHRFAWSVTNSGTPKQSTSGTETIRLDTTVLISNHSCASRTLSNSNAACPSAAPYRRMTTLVSGGAGTRRIGLCCR